MLYQTGVCSLPVFCSLEAEVDHLSDAEPRTLDRHWALLSGCMLLGVAAAMTDHLLQH